MTMSLEFPQITEADRALIRAAAGPHRTAGDELEALTRATGESLTRTWQRLNGLISDPRAWDLEPAAMRILFDRRQRYSRLRSVR